MWWSDESRVSSLLYKCKLGVLNQLTVQYVYNRVFIV